MYILWDLRGRPSFPISIPESMDTTALSRSVCLLICKVEVTWILIASSHHPAPTSHTHL